MRKRVKRFGKRKSIGTVKSRGSERVSIDRLNKPVRINKFIADSGFCSRRKAEEYIKDGLVKINGKLCTDLSTKVLKKDLVTINGDPISETEKNVYILLNKPKDSITTTKDEMNRRTVTDIVNKNIRIYPVGRLDRNTTGALLLTNDGDLAHRLMHPSFKTEKIYNVKLDKSLSFEHAQKISEGVSLEDYNTSPCDVFIHPDDNSKVTLTLQEGKNREIRNLFEHFGYKVKQLDRKYFANLSTKGLARGEYRHLKKNEIDSLRKLVGLEIV